MTSELVVEQLKEKIRNTASGRSLHHSEALKSIIGTFIPVVEKQSAPLETSKPAQRYRCLYCPCKGLKIICPRCHRTRQPIHWKNHPTCFFMLCSFDYVTMAMSSHFKNNHWTWQLPSAGRWSRRLRPEHLRRISAPLFKTDGLCIACLQLAICI